MAFDCSGHGAGKDIEDDLKADSMSGVMADTRRSRPSRTGWHREIARIVLSLGIVCGASIAFAQAPREFPSSDSGWTSHDLPPEVPKQPTVPVIERKARLAPPDRSMSEINPNTPTVKPVAAFSLESILDKPLVDIQIEGNDTILSDAILQKIESRAGRVATQASIQRDVSHLMNTRWFYSVKPVFRESDEGPILVFQVVERPILRSVTFVGNKKVKTGELQAQTGLRPNHAYDVAANIESVHRLKQLYKEKGYLFAEVKLTKGSRPDERDVEFEIIEGPKSKIWYIEFEGNKFASDAILKTKISSKTLKVWIIQGDYDPDVIRNDVLALKQYYLSLGFFDVDVQSEELFSEDKSKVTVRFTINEGRRYKVDKIDVVGNDVIGAELLLKNLKLKSGDYFNERFLKEDVQKMTDLYDAQGRLFAKVMPTPRFRQDDDAVVDLVYQIDEDVPRYIGEIKVHIAGDYPHSKEEVVRQQVTRFLKPGQLARSSDLRMAQARVNGSGLWDRTTPPVFDIVPNPGYDYWIPSEIRGQNIDFEIPEASETTTHKNTFDFEDLFTPGESPVGTAPLFEPSRAAPSHEVPSGRMSLPDRVPAVEFSAPAAAVPEFPASPSVETHSEAALPPIRRRPAGSVSRETSHETTTSFASVPALAATSDAAPAESSFEESSDFVISPDLVFRAQSPAGMDYYRTQSLDAYAQPVPQNYLQGVSPQGDPFGDALTTPPPGFVDVNIEVTEGRTGRLMFGVGVNSDAGLVGSFVLQEDNFDILRPPTSFADIINGQAWRGAGQSFRVEAVPGTEVSRYMASWSDPYFLRTDFSLGVSGFYYNRYFEDWTEERLGGRVSLGYIISRYWSAGAFVRLEDVDIRDIPAINPPPQLVAVKGSNFLSTAGANIQYDARDNSFFPTTGHYANFTYEQGFGEFTYPRFDLSGGKFFTVYERPDGFGKQILSLTGQLGYTGDNTPVFEKFFAGGYSSFRGFYFRGVSPEVNNVKVGGNFLAIGSAEYMIPITASDNIRTVVFTDFGTVNPDVSLDNFRVTAGFGFRLTIPAMGPAPLAFDFAWPLKRNEEDRLRVFSFYVGFNR